ncbi:MAG: glycoside hydrolase family 57 protein [Bryobacteraceae bacterium]
MPRIYLCFLWHMHQPFYKNLISGEYRLPWTRMHALKDYYGMVRILEEFPEVKQTFNLVPSMIVQTEEYASGEAHDPFLRCALKPAETLTESDKSFILQQFFHADPAHMIYRYPRYGELYDAYDAAQRSVDRTARVIGMQGFRDLQVLSQIAWFDEEFLEHDPEVKALVTKGRNFSLEDQAVMGRKQREILARVLPIYQKLAGTGQIEISTTPFYHPILPLICDSDIAGVSHPGAPLPSRFRYPEDARVQLEMSREYMQSRFGAAPAGLWPSEGSVSDEAFTVAADLGFQWAATDNGILDRTLKRSVGVDGIYKPYLWERDGRRMHVIFRDHFLSDLIGFVYSKMGAAEAAADFLHRINENCRGILSSGRDALVPIVLDGENAWEYYDHNGRPFLRELYRRITDDTQMIATTVSEALARVEPQTLDHIFPGSWINANFGVWIGAEEDNLAWEYLLRARETYERAANVPEAQKRLAYEELLIAEGSDWCWWYGPEHSSQQRTEFDQLYRDHLANVYRALNMQPPEELSRPILKSIPVREFHMSPTGHIQPCIDGEVSSYFEWIGAGIYRVDPRSGSMHGQKFVVRELHYGSDGSNLYLRVDFDEKSMEPRSGMDVRLNVENASFAVRIERGDARQINPNSVPLECAFKKVLELKVPLSALRGRPESLVRFQVSVWQDGLPLDAAPQHGWLELTAADAEW